jgi:chromosome segregation ATPase
MNKYTIAIVAMLLFAAQASAQEVQTSATSATSVAPVQGSMIQDKGGAYKTIREGDAARQAQQLRENMRGVNKTTREGVQREIKDMRAGATSTRQEIKNTLEQQREMVKQKMEQAKQAMEVRKEEFKKTVEVKKEEAKKKIEENRTKLQEKLKGIKDEKKKQAVEKADKQLADLNTNRLEHFSSVVTQIEKVLQNITSREAKAEAAGKDVAVVKADVTAAQAAIAAARAAIVTQSAKTYVLAIGQEATLRTDVDKSRKALAADLKVVEGAVKAAHEAIKKAATDLAKIQGVNTVDVPASTATSTTATSTGTSTNQ